MLVHSRVTPSIKFTGTHLYSWVERGTVRVKCLAQEHNTMSPARDRTRTTRSGDKRTNHEVTACLQELIHPQSSQRFCLVKHYYKASISTSRLVRRFSQEFRIERHKLLWAGYACRHLHRSKLPLKGNGVAVRGYAENPPETSEDTQPKLWHGEGMNSLSGTGICQHQGSTEL